MCRKLGPDTAAAWCATAVRLDTLQLSHVLCRAAVRCAGRLQPNLYCGCCLRTLGLQGAPGPRPARQAGRRRQHRREVRNRHARKCDSARSQGQRSPEVHSQLRRPIAAFAIPVNDTVGSVDTLGCLEALSWGSGGVLLGSLGDIAPPLQSTFREVLPQVCVTLIGLG